MLWLPSHCSILEYALFDLNSVSSCRRSMRQAPLRQNYLQTRRKNIYVSRDVELKPVGIECLVEDDTAFTGTKVYHIVNPPATCRSNVTADVLFCNPKSMAWSQMPQTQEDILWWASAKRVDIVRCQSQANQTDRLYRRACMNQLGSRVLPSGEEQKSSGSCRNQSLPLGVR